MGRRLETLYLVTRDRDAAEILQDAEPNMPLAVFLEQTGSRIHPPRHDLDLARPVCHFYVEWVRDDGSAAGRHHRSATASRPGPSDPAAPPAAGAGGSDLDAIFSRYDVPEARGGRADRDPPARINDDTAVFYAYQDEILEIRRYLEHDLSVCVCCDKILVAHLVRNVFGGCAKKPVLDTAAPAQPEEGGAPILQRRVERARQGARVRIEGVSRLLNELKEDEVLVLKSLDVLTTISESMLTDAAKGMIEILYREAEKIVLGFFDPALRVPEIIQKRFPIRIEVSTIKRDALERLVTVGERRKFAHFNTRELYKNVSGLNAVEFRTGMRFVEKECVDGSDPALIYRTIRKFKKAHSTEIQIPDVTFDDIGGYEEVKREIREIISLINGDFSDEPADREAAESLVPSGILFHGPPGTGKTLFSKAIANSINATVQVVSGPEVMSRWVGESEERIRRIFETARRNAPSVIVFDEFDSIAARRGGSGDGGTRAGNAVVAQLLTEMDGFRTGERILVIGTTNRPDIIDKAFKERPDRMVPIEIPLPEEAARRRIAAIYRDRFRLGDVSDALLDVVAEFTEGFNGDEIQSVFREAKRRELLRKRKADARLFGGLVARMKKRKEDAGRTHL